MKNSASAGQIWEMSKAYMGSNTVKRYDGVIVGESVKNLGTFLQTKGSIDFSHISNETKQDERLQKYNIMQVIPTKRLSEIGNTSEFYVITDEHGHDIGTCEIGDNGPIFKLNPKIREANNRIIESADEKYRDALREEFELNSMEDIVEKLAKGEEIALSSKEQADDIGKEQTEGSEHADGAEGQDEEEKQALANMPADMRAEVVALCNSQNIKIKEVMVVQDATDVHREMGEGRNPVRPSGGPVIMVRTSGSGAETKDNVLLFQKGQLLPDTGNQRDRLLELMYQHKGSKNLTDLEDHREDNVMDNLRQNIEEYEQQLEYYSKCDFQNEDEKAQCIEAARARLLSDTREDMQGYVADNNGDVASLYRAIEEEATKENRDDLVQEKINSNKEREQEEYDEMMNPTANLRNH